MALDEKTIALVCQLQDGLFDLSEDRVAQMVREARDEALAEAKTILKWLMVQTILKQATGTREDTHNGSTLTAGETDGLAIRVDDLLANEAPSSSTPAQERGAENREQIEQEIEAIRQRIAANERILSQTRAFPAEGEAAPAPSLDDPPGTSAEETETGCAYYVYGIVRSDGSQPLEGLPAEGICPACPVYALPYPYPATTASEAVLHSADQTIQAIVSRVSLRDFGPERLDENLDDMRWLEARVRAHQGILDAVAASRTLIPMRFCTIYRSEERVRKMLEQHHAGFVKALARLDGKREWGVKVYCDSQVLAQKVGLVSDRAKKLEAEIAARSSGAAYFLRKKLDETITEEAEHVRDEFAQRSHDRLAVHAAEAVINPLLAKELTGRKEPLVLNGAYLVAEEQLAAFRAELTALQDECGNLGFSYEMTGAWPPYNFVGISFEEHVADE
jgi:hypothetical protein